MVPGGRRPVEPGSLPGAASRTYTSTDVDQGKRIRVRVAYTDNDCYEQTADSTAIDNIYAAGLALSGEARVGQTLTAAADGITDSAGLSSPSFTWR